VDIGLLETVLREIPGVTAVHDIHVWTVRSPAQEIVAYCRGPYCELSYEAVAALRARGFKVYRLEDGLPEWRAAGLPVVTGATL
jgi:rhodanese-related sulfurtransferase